MKYKYLPKITQWSLFILGVVHLTIGMTLSIHEQKKYRDYTAESSGLYSSKDGVEILGIDNFKSQIYGNERAFFVEFYNSWCGFCQRFAPSWKALATDLKVWRNLVGIAAIDCSNEKNNPICRDFEIMSYPTLKYFHEKYKEGPKNLGQNVNAGSDVEEHRKKLLEVLVKEQKENRGKHYPNLLPYVYNDTLHLFDGSLPDVHYAILVIQNESDFIAQELSLDLHKLKNVIVTYAIDSSPVNSELSKQLKVSKLPALFAVGRNNSLKPLKPLLATREAFKKVVREFLESQHINVPEDSTKMIYRGKWRDSVVPDIEGFIQEKEHEALKKRIRQMGDVVFQMDLETALRYSLKHEIVSVKEIKGEKLEALRAYLNILVKFFPFGKFGQMFLIELRDFVSNTDVVNGDEIGVMIEGAEKEYRLVFSSPPHWLACKGSTPAHRGYPCGLWKMFHYLTVNAAEYNIGLKGSNSRIVLEAMHGYVKHFLGCTDCSKHFQDMAKRRELSKVSSWPDSILWLWMAHNEVNKRLAGDQTEDPEYPKYQFPSKERCPRCHNANDTWNFAEVLHYLKHMYSNINVRYIGSDTRILHMGLNGQVTHKADVGFFKTIDTFMCFILYIASLLLILILIHMFLKQRKYRKKMYVHDLLGKV